MTARGRSGRRLAAGAIIVGLALAGAGCGGGDAERSNAYVNRVNDAQTRFASSFERLSRQITSASSPAQDRKTLRSVAASVDVTVADLRKIEPPEKVKKLHGDLVDAISGYGEAIGAAERNLGGGATEAAQAQARLAADTTRTSTLVTSTIAQINQKLRE